MELTCPACNKAGQTGAACQRCGCELSRLQSIAMAAAMRLEAALAALEACDWLSALDEATASWGLHRSPAAARVAFLAAAAGADHRRALSWRERALSAGAGQH